MKKICVITGTRAEYGILYWTIKEIINDPSLEMQLCVTGMHLSPEFGLTYQQIEEDGIRIDYKVEMLMSSDTSVGISKSIGLGVIGFADAFEKLQPDLILVLGDRFEIFAAVTAAMIARIPVAHCSGGESTEGLIDESIRHSITKMSHIHFPATDQYRKRIIQLGEAPEFVFNVGALGIENINRLNLLSLSDFERSIDFRLAKVCFLITFHPVTLDADSSELQFNELLAALEQYEDASLIFTKPNADTSGRIIGRLIDQYVKKNFKKSVSFTSLGQLRYLSAIKHVDVVIGNSSSGLVEVPSFKKPTINIGDRQRGRICAESVINSKPSAQAIQNAIYRAMSSEFQEALKGVSNPYGSGNSSKIIVQTIKDTPLSGIIKKKFHNISVS
jgi:GDP/UDP-N,N'-diacetylbacillosamine 2-epimerase (hydrolysing)